MKNYRIKALCEKINKSKPKILVLGDIMLDHYIYGTVDRISPEAPVPIVNYKKEMNVLGGAGNVGHNLINLGARVNVASLVGDDLDGKIIKKLLKNIKISTEYIFSNENINTTKKTRFIAEGAHLLRLDNDSKGFIKSAFRAFETLLNNNVNDFDCIIISDYGKGVCSDLLVEKIIMKANKLNIPTFIDPKNSNWSKFSKATCITPNIKEIEDELKINLKSNSNFEDAGRIILEKYKLNSCLITRGADGMTYYETDNVIHQKVGKKEVFDVSGAGDTVIACLATAKCSGIDLSDAIKISSIASSQVVSHIGTTPFNIEMLKNYE